MAQPAAEKAKKASDLLATQNRKTTLVLRGYQHAELKRIAFDNDTTLKDLLIEAADMIIKKYRKELKE